MSVLTFGSGKRLGIKKALDTTGNAGMQDLEDQYKYMAMGSGSYYMYEPSGKLRWVKTPAHTSGSKSYSCKSVMGASDISKRGHLYLTLVWVKTKGVFNAARTYR